MRNIGHGSHHSQFQSIIILIILPNARSTKFILKILFGYSTQTIQPIGCQSRRSRGITIAACSPQTLPHPAVLLLPRRRSIKYRIECVKHLYLYLLKVVSFKFDVMEWSTVAILQCSEYKQHCRIC